MNAIIKLQGEMIALQTPYNSEFVNLLKRDIPHVDRKWDAASKCWLVSQDQEQEALAIVARFFDIIDGRLKSANEIDEAQIDAEIAKIQDEQKYILENEVRIKDLIADLSAKISRYSYGSKSSIKYGLAQERALLQHSLNNARQPVERLAEMQVRGLAAAVKYLRSK